MGPPANASFMDSRETRGHGGRLSNKENLIELRTVLMHKKVIRKKHIALPNGDFSWVIYQSHGRIRKKQSPEQQIKPRE